MFLAGNNLKLLASDLVRFGPLGIVSVKDVALVNDTTQLVQHDSVAEHLFADDVHIFVATVVCVSQQTVLLKGVIRNEKKQKKTLNLSLSVRHQKKIKIIRYASHLHLNPY